MWQLEYFKGGGMWRIIYDEKFESAKRRKTRGLPALAARDEANVEMWGNLDETGDEKPDGT